MSMPKQNMCEASSPASRKLGGLLRRHPASRANIESSVAERIRARRLEIEVSPRLLPYKKVSCALGEISSVFEYLSKASPDDPPLVSLHEALYGEIGKKNDRVRGLKIWTGTDDGVIVQRINDWISESTDSFKSRFFGKTENGEIFSILSKPMRSADERRRRGRRLITKSPKKSTVNPKSLIAKQSLRRVSPAKSIKHNKDAASAPIASVPQFGSRPVFYEADAFLAFIERKFPGVLDQWEGLNVNEKLAYAGLAHVYKSSSA